MKKLKHNITNIKFAVIAGGGELPKLVIESLQQQEKDFIVIAVKSDADETYMPVENCYWISIYNPSIAIKLMQKTKVTHLIFAGNIKRPSLLSINFDSTMLSFLARMGFAKLKGGTDYIHRVIIDFVESKGFQVMPPEQIVSDLISPKGVLGNVKPAKADLEDVYLGQKVLEKLGEMDVGQSVIVENKCVLGIEALEGTDKLIKRCKELKSEKQRLGVLIKMKKLGQEKRIDLPTIGTKTVEMIYNAGLKGIAIEAGFSLIIDIKRVINVANEKGVFLIGI